MAIFTGKSAADTGHSLRAEHEQHLASMRDRVDARHIVVEDRLAALEAEDAELHTLAAEIGPAAE